MQVDLLEENGYLSTTVEMKTFEDVDLAFHHLSRKVNNKEKMFVIYEVYILDH